MTSGTGADVVIVGTGVIGCLIAEQLLDAGHSVTMLEAAPRVSRWEIVENFRNLPPSSRTDPDAPYPPTPWAPHPMWLDHKQTEDSYLQTTGPNARAYQQDYVRYAGGSTWHWAGICWRLTPEDMRLRSLYGVGRDWPSVTTCWSPITPAPNTRWASAARRTRRYNGRRSGRSPTRWVGCPLVRANRPSPTPPRGWG